MNIPRKFVALITIYEVIYAPIDFCWIYTPLFWFSGSIALPHFRERTNEGLLSFRNHPHHAEGRFRNAEKGDGRVEVLRKNRA